MEEVRINIEFQWKREDPAWGYRSGEHPIKKDHGRKTAFFLFGASRIVIKAAPSTATPFRLQSDVLPSRDGSHPVDSGRGHLPHLPTERG